MSPRWLDAALVSLAHRVHMDNPWSCPISAIAVVTHPRSPRPPSKQGSVESVQMNGSRPGSPSWMC
jgi:hypothetical protein